jgi:hypothetical protein
LLQNVSGDRGEIVEMTGTAAIGFTTVIVLLLGTGVAADTEIHRCLLDDGTIAFQETPCPDAAIDAGAANKAADSRSAGKPHDGNDDSDFASPFDEPPVPVTPSEPKRPTPGTEDRADCEKTTRDAIDAIDLEMKENAYTRVQGQAYLAELLVLTARLRECKQL